MLKGLRLYQSPRSRREYLSARKSVRPLAALVLLVLSFIPLIITVAWRDGADSVLSRRTAQSLEALVTSRSVDFSPGYCKQLPAKAPGEALPRPTNVFKSANRAWLALLIPGVVFCFIGLAIVTDDYFVPALERICERLHLSADVAGATFMAAGSSAPELLASLVSVFLTKDDVGIGTIVGSAVFNVLVIIGLSGALAGSSLDLDFRPLLRDSFFYVVSIVLLIVFVMFSTPGKANWWEGLILMLAYVVYILFMKFGNAWYFRFTEKWAEEPQVVSDEENGTFAQPSHIAVPQPTLVGYKNLNPRSQIRTAFYGVVAFNEFSNGTGSAAPKKFLGVPRPNTMLGWIMFPVFLPWNLLFMFTIVDCSHPNRGKWWPLSFIASIIWISIISIVMVEGARLAGCYVGIPSAVMGLTFLAAGTSVPDALASVAVARNGQGNMAVSNAIGSNVFDILLGLGLPWFLAELILKKPQYITIRPITRVVVPIAILFVIIILLVALLMVLRWKLSKTLGFSLFFVYALFITYSLLETYVFKF